MRAVALTFTFSILSLIWRADAAGETILVEPEGACGGNAPCFSTMEEAMGAAIGGDEVLVSKGSYEEDVIVALDPSEVVKIDPGWSGAFSSKEGSTSLTIGETDAADTTALRSLLIVGGTLRIEHTPTPCPDGILDQAIAPDFYGIDALQVPEGAVLSFCAPVGPPTVPEGMSPDRVRFAFLSRMEPPCGAISMKVRQLSGLQLMINAGPSSSGQVSFIAQSGMSHVPERAAPGTYVVELTGMPAPCIVYRVGWDWD